MFDYRPSYELDGAKGSSFAQKIKDLWWRICTKEGSILEAPITLWKADGTVDKGTTSLFVEAGYNKANNAILRAKLDQILANQVIILDKLSKLP